MSYNGVAYIVSQGDYTCLGQ
ncbi:unnamed protein product, partial [Rotaria sp. Silwood1]